MQTHRKWDMYDFTKEEIENLAEYLKRTKVVVDCWKAAKMSPEARKRIEDRILAPPKEENP